MEDRMLDRRNGEALGIYRNRAGEAVAHIAISAEGQSESQDKGDDHPFGRDQPPRDRPVHGSQDGRQRISTSPRSILSF